jgi:O-antigen/teichoic acid export membrane protein
MITRLKAITSHSGFQRYAKNTGWMFTEQFLRIITGLFVGIWVAQYLGPVSFGEYSYALSFVLIFSTFAALGLDAIVTRSVVHDPHNEVIYLGTAFWLKIAGALISFILALLTIPFAQVTPTVSLYILIIASGMIFQAFDVIGFYFQAKVLSKYVSICKITQIFLSSLIKIYLIMTHADLLWFVIVVLMDQITLGLTLFIAYSKVEKKFFYSKFNFTIAKKMLSDAWPLLGSALTFIIYTRIDQIMIGHMLDISQVGYFSAAVRLTDVASSIPAIITASLFPAILNAKKDSHSNYLSRIYNMHNILFYISLFIFFIAFFFAKEIIYLLFGEPYAASASILTILLFGNIFLAMAIVNYRILLAENLQIISMYRGVVGAVVNITLNLILIPRYGIQGAAFATLFAHAVSGYLMMGLGQRTRFIFWIQTKVLFFYPLYGILIKKTRLK